MAFIYIKLSKPGLNGLSLPAVTLVLQSLGDFVSFCAGVQSSLVQDVNFCTSAVFSSLFHTDMPLASNFRGLCFGGCLVF